MFVLELTVNFGVDTLIWNGNNTVTDNGISKNNILRLERYNLLTTY